MLSKPLPRSSVGKLFSAWNSTARRSRMVLVYSLRLRRRAVTRPGSGFTPRSAFSNSAVRNWTTESISGGRGTPLGGISPARSLRRMMSQPSRLLVSDAGWVKGAISTPPEARASLWQGEQVRESKGATVFSKVGASAAESTPQADTVSAKLRIPQRISRIPSTKMLQHREAKCAGGHGGIVSFSSIGVGRRPRWGVSRKVR